MSTLQTDTVAAANDGATTMDERYFVASSWTLIRRRFVQHRLALVGGVALVTIYFLAAFAGFFAVAGTFERHPEHLFAPPQRRALRVARSLCLALSFTLTVTGALTGCGQSESEDGQPSTFRVVKAVMKSLLSNSVEVKESPTEGASTSQQPGRSEPASSSEPEAGTPPAVLAEAEAPQTCSVPYGGAVTIIPVRNANALQRSVAERPSRGLVYETEDTAIFDNGQVLTTNLEGLGTHLGAVGWSANPMKILGASVRPGGSSRNVGWNSAENTKSKSKRGKRKRRRRG